MKHLGGSKRLDQNTAKELMKRFLIAQYLNEVEGEAIGGDRILTMFWVDKVITLSGESEYDEIESDFYSWIYNTDTRPQNIIDTILTILVSRDEEVTGG